MRVVSYVKPHGEAPSVTREPWRQLLLDGADTIERVGLARYMQRAPDGSMCFLGVLRYLTLRANGGISANGGIDGWPAWKAFCAMQEHLRMCPIDFNNNVAKDARHLASEMRAAGSQ